MWNDPRGRSYVCTTDGNERTNEREGRPRQKMRSRDSNEARRFTHRPQKKKKKNYPLHFSPATPFRHGQMFRFRSHRLVQENWIALKPGTLELKGCPDPSCRDEELTGGVYIYIHIKRCTESLTWYWIATAVPFRSFQPGKRYERRSRINY